MGLFGVFLGNMESSAFKSDQANHSSFARDAFGYTLHYFQGDYTAAAQTTGNYFSPFADMSRLQSQETNLYNGNISFSVNSIPESNQQQYLPAPLLTKYRYDQLNRIRSATYASDLNPSSQAWEGSFIEDYASTYSYDPNGNIQSLRRNQHNSAPPEMDDLTYRYRPGTNQLDFVEDAVSASAAANDIDNQSAGNYEYDPIGNLVKDSAEGISSIIWLANNKIGRITKTNGMVIQFTYDAQGQRITKKVEKMVAGVLTSEIEFYLRDASGNVMANSANLILKIYLKHTLKVRF
jgi:YD repeat-containing protein